MLTMPSYTPSVSGTSNPHSHERSMPILFRGAVVQDTCTSIVHRHITLHLLFSNYDTDTNVQLHANTCTKPPHVQVLIGQSCPCT